MQIVSTLIIVALGQWACLTTPVTSGTNAAAVKGSEAKMVVHAKRGETFTIRLEANITTGYRWQIAGQLDKAALELVGTKYEDAQAPGRLGAKGSQVFTFKALAPSKTKVKFVYARPWEANKSADKKIYEVEID